MACTDETTFTDEERAILEGMKLPAAVPANPSNRVADIMQAAVLGKKFFFDSRFSGALGVANDGVTNGSLGPAGTVGKIACASCHQLESGGADRRSKPSATSLGSNYGLRNSPTVINAALADISVGGWQLWDGRKDSLWSLALGPMEGANEHNGSRLQYAHLVYQKYRAEYEAIFEPMPDLSNTARFPESGKPAPAGMPPTAFDTMDPADKVAINRIYSNIGKALEAYQRLLVSQNFEPSPFDQMLAGNDAAMSASAIRGAKLFIGKAACNECHNNSLFNDNKFHNIGCPQAGQNVPSVDLGRMNAFRVLRSDPFTRAGMYSDAQTDAHIVDLPMDNTAEAEFTKGMFRTPSLRNIEKTGPYMHNGIYTTLWDVVAHYNFGGGTGAFSGVKEATISPLLLTDDEMNDIVEFLRALSDGPPRQMNDFPEGLLAPPVLPQ